MNSRVPASKHSPFLSRLLDRFPSAVRRCRTLFIRYFFFHSALISQLVVLDTCLIWFRFLVLTSILIQLVSTVICSYICHCWAQNLSCIVCSWWWFTWSSRRCESLDHSRRFPGWRSRSSGRRMRGRRSDCRWGTNSPSHSCQRRSCMTPFKLTGMEIEIIHLWLKWNKWYRLNQSYSRSEWLSRCAVETWMRFFSLKNTLFKLSETDKPCLLGIKHSHTFHISILLVLLSLLIVLSLTGSLFTISTRVRPNVLIVFVIIELFVFIVLILWLIVGHHLNRVTCECTLNI